MGELLQSRLAQIRGRVRQVLWLHGASWLVAAFIGSALAAGWLDWLIHLDDAGVRLILGLGILGLSGWIGYRHLVRPLSVRLDDLDLALRIEDRYPGFKDSFASTVQFLQDGRNSRLGSPALQQQVIAQTMSRVERIEIHDVVQTRAVRRTATLAVVVCITAAILVGFNQVEAATALKRLVFPFAENPWPKQTELRLVDAAMEVIEADPQDPLRVARGETLDIYVININGAGRMPNDVTLQFRAANGEITSEAVTRGSVRDATGGAREVCVANIVVKAPLAFRAIGGDDQDMPWHALDVVPPPVVKNLQLTLTPPAYAGGSPVRLPRGVGHVEGLVGTRVEIGAEVSKPLGTARLRVKDQQQFPLEMSEDGRKLSGGFVIQDAGVYSYWLDLKDRQGFANNDAPRYEVRGIQDSVPEIAIEIPDAGLQVTAEADVPIRTVAKDDLGLKEIRLRHRDRQSPEGEMTTVPLFDGEGRPAQKGVDYVWPLAGLKLTTGAQLVFHTEATDDYDLDGEHVGRSLNRTLTIVTRDEKLQELSDRQSDLLADLERTAKLQADAHTQVAELKLQLEKAGKLRPEDLDLLKRVELQQRQISGDLQDSGEGLQARTRAMLDELHYNHVDDSDSEQRLSQIADEIERVSSENLPVIEQELTQARKDSGGAETRPSSDIVPPEKRPSEKQPSEKRPPDARSPEQTGQPGQTENPQRPKAGEPRERPASRTTAEALEIAAQNQAAVRDSLRDLLRELVQWRDERNVTRDLAEIIGDQEQLNQETSRIGQQTVTRPLQELTPQERADLARLAERQLQQAGRVDDLQGKLEQMLNRGEQEGTSAPASLQDALQQLQQEAAAAELKDAARQVGENNVGRAAQLQEQGLQKLREMDDILKNRGESDTEALVKQFKQAEQQVDLLRKEQAELMEKVAAAEQLADPPERLEQLLQLQKEQARLEQQTAQLARRLRRLQAERPGNSAKRAAERMQEAQQNLDKDAGKQAAEEQQEALDDLEQAQRELAAERKQAEEQLAREQLAKIADELNAMIPRQQGVIDEVQRLAEVQAEKGNLTRGQLRSLRELADVERGLQQETLRLAETLSAAEVHHFALRGAAAQMETVAAQLTERNLGPEALRPAESARRVFEGIVDAVAQDKRPKPGSQQEGGGGVGEEQTGPETDGIPALAEVKLLKNLQQLLNDRTRELGELLQTQGDLTPPQQTELQQLAEQQGALADLARNLTKLAAGPDDGGEQPAPPKEKTP